jgi:UV excision repair protein RAD23
MKLIHSGKVLKDDDVIESCNIKPNDFLVVMIAKAKKAVVKPAAAASAATEPSTPAASAGIPPTPAAPAPSATAAASAPAATAAASNVSSPDEFPAEVVNNLIALGFPESSVRACLRASDGNPDIAVEFLMNGVPPELEGGDAAAVASNSGGSSSSSGGSGGGAGGPLEALRNHPQFDALRRLVQSNPAMLQAVLSQIGQQQPELLTAINANQAAFLEMMNEPVADAPAAPVAPVLPRAGGAANPFAGVPGVEALGNPVQLAQMLQAMPPQEQQAMAQMMGMDVTQLQHLAQMISAMPPEQVQQHMNMAMQQQGLGGLMGQAGGMGGAQVLRLSEEEMAAVDRLTEMGFDRSEAAQAYLACDKNEALAANLLMDGGFGGFGGDGDDDLGGGDDMYD